LEHSDLNVLPIQEHVEVKEISEEPKKDDKRRSITWTFLSGRKTLGFPTNEEPYVGELQSMEKDPEMLAEPHNITVNEVPYPTRQVKGLKLFLRE
jgi:hypothetical protein